MDNNTKSELVSFDDKVDDSDDSDGEDCHGHNSDVDVNDNTLWQNFSEHFYEKKDEFNKIYNSVKNVLAKGKVPEIKRLREQFIKAQDFFHHTENPANGLSAEQMLFNESINEKYESLRRLKIICERHSNAAVEFEHLVWLRIREHWLKVKAKRSLKEIGVAGNVENRYDDIKSLLNEIAVYEKHRAEMKPEMASLNRIVEAARADIYGVVM